MLDFVPLSISKSREGRWHEEIIGDVWGTSVMVGVRFIDRTRARGVTVSGNESMGEVLFLLGFEASNPWVYSKGTE